MSRLAELNALPAPAAVETMLQCCGSRAWARRMEALRPFPSPDDLLRAADEEWWALGEEDWMEAFRSHPRIGERRAEAAQTERERRWSAGEQAKVASAADDTLRALADGNREYEDRFGFIYLVCATGRTADEMLDLLQARLRNPPAEELRVAAGEQARITRLRLQKLLDSPEPIGHP